MTWMCSPPQTALQWDALLTRRIRFAVRNSCDAPATDICRLQLASSRDELRNCEIRPLLGARALTITYGRDSRTEVSGDNETFIAAIKRRASNSPD